MTKCQNWQFSRVLHMAMHRLLKILISESVGNCICMCNSMLLPDISCHGRQPQATAVTVTVDGHVMPEIEYGELIFDIQDLPTGNSCLLCVRPASKNIKYISTT